MRWIEPARGAEIIRSRWLWWPLRVCAETRWLERATWVEVWCGSAYGWKPVRWVD